MIETAETPPAIMASRERSRTSSRPPVSLDNAASRMAPAVPPRWPWVSCQPGNAGTSAKKIEASSTPTIARNTRNGSRLKPLWLMMRSPQAITMPPSR